ncbi:MAG: AarF/ABC1/UbiB kinase family protein [Actinobacteria bacterium]|nr:AarF/ABC1/UbiB kinase family protein [Actinomycetota bacterium]
MAPKDESAVPQSRLGRAGRIGKALGGGGLKLAGTAGTNVLRSREGGKQAMERRHYESAENMVKALGSLRGAAIKIAQLASFIDVDLLPDEYREIYQKQLGTLRASAPPMPWKKVKTVLNDQWDRPIGRIFSEFDEEAVAAASIGQVHRATLKDGREVAVKIQYPDVADALRADMQNAALFLRLGKLIAPGLDAKAAAAELKARVLEELDYELEAQNQRRFARAYRGHPFICVPEVETSLSRERVLVSEWVEGVDFDTVLERPQAERDRFGEIVYRFAFGSIYHLHQLNADTHPGNYLAMDDGRVAFLDFGMTKRLTDDQIRLQVAAARAVLEDDSDAFGIAMEEMGFIRDYKSFNMDLLRDHVNLTSGWYLNGRKTRITPELVTRSLSELADPRGKAFELTRTANLPADELLGRRMETGVLAVLGKLHANANWTRICREWMFAEKPSTPLGKDEWHFFEERGHSRRPLAKL